MEFKGEIRVKVETNERMKSEGERRNAEEAHIFIDLCTLV